MKNLILPMELAGRYTMVAKKLDANGEVISERVLADWFDNLITTIGLNRLGTGSVYNNCRVGSGSTPPANGDTSLVSQIGVTGTLQAQNNGHSASAPWYGWIRFTYRFGAGAATGNVSEVGIGWATTGATLFSRALVRDAEGDPTTITVLADEVLDVTYELRNYAPTADVTFDLVIAGVTYGVTGRACQANSEWSPYTTLVYGSTNAPVLTPYSGAAGTVIQDPSGTQSDGASGTNATYSNNSLKRTGTAAWGLLQGNLDGGGIKTIAMQTNMGSKFQFEFSAKIPKDATKVLTIGYEYSWARHA
jgi:hypothetical protein